MQNRKTDDPAIRINGDAGIALMLEKRVRIVFRQSLELRKRIAFFYDFIPYFQTI